jgi:putative NIF3 family GTP cyclohydrolase 1 type 2
MTAREVIDLVRKNLGVPFNENTFRDTFKIGNPDSEVKGIATTCMVTYDMLRRTHAAGLNLVISHEDTWWNDRDDTKDLQDNPLYKEKRDFCLKNGLIIWRFHDHQHSRKPDQSIVASLRAVGIEDENAFMNSGKLYTIPEMTLGAFASQIKKRTGSRAFRVVGNPNAKVSKILLGPGYASPRMTAEADVVIGGESPETDGAFDNPEYCMDAATLGIAKGQIILGHIVSEEPGMEECAKWLRTFITGIPIQFVPAGEPFWT